jgi:hypothetical protein
LNGKDALMGIVAVTLVYPLSRFYDEVIVRTELMCLATPFSHANGPRKLENKDHAWADCIKRTVSQ